MTGQPEAAAQNPEDEAELVSEFPPPPYYYTQASASAFTPASAHTSGQASASEPTPISTSALTPPPIPHDALIRSTKKAAALAKKKDLEEKARLGGVEGMGMGMGMGMGLGMDGAGMLDGGTQIMDTDQGPTVAVFGDESYVEDPDLITVEHDCNDPQEVKREVSRLNKEILKGFIKLVGDLVNNPLDHEQCREGLLQNIEFMLKECNKFREHQARELLIELLEKQLADRESALKVLNQNVNDSNRALEELKIVEHLDVSD